MTLPFAKLRELPRFQDGAYALVRPDVWITFGPDSVGVPNNPANPMHTVPYMLARFSTGELALFRWDKGNNTWQVPPVATFFPPLSLEHTTCAFDSNGYMWFVGVDTTRAPNQDNLLAQRAFGPGIAPAYVGKGFDPMLFNSMNMNGLTANAYVGLVCVSGDRANLAFGKPDTAGLENVAALPAGAPWWLFTIYPNTNQSLQAELTRSTRNANGLYDKVVVASSLIA